MPSDPDPAPRVAVVTVSYRSEDVLPGFLSSVPAASSGPLELVVVDNLADGDDRIERMTRASGGRYLRMDRNAGYGAAMNAGAASLTPGIEWLLLSNPDVELGPGVIDGLVAAATETDAAAVGPAIHDDAGAVYPSARAIPSLRTGIGHALFGSLWAENPWSAAYTRSAATGERRETGWLSGACLLVRRRAFDSVGGFDPDYFMYFEDVDLGFRLGRAGYRSLYEPSAVVRHSGGHSTRSESARMIAAHHASARRFLAKKYSGPLLWPVRTVLTAGLLVRSAVLQRRHRQPREE